MSGALRLYIRFFIFCFYQDKFLVAIYALGGADTWATSNTLAGAIRNLEYDLIITRRQAIDGDTAQVGPQIAEHLDIPVISYAQNIEADGEHLIVQRQYEDRYHTVKVKMLCLITALAELNKPRYMTPGGIFEAIDKPVTVYSKENLIDVDDGNLGLKGSPTKIAKVHWHLWSMSLNRKLFWWGQRP